ncbi:MAG: P1 family peptidase [Bacteroidota bacterium]
MNAAAVLPDGFAVGHWEDPEGATGCTVILCPERTVGGCDVRGSSPGSRETALLASEKTMQEVHAVLLAGGSAFGLAAADGVMRYLEEKGRGYGTPWGKIPIVPAAVIYDLNIGSSLVRPTAEAGYSASLAASSEPSRQGSVGAGMGATVGKWAGVAGRMRGGLGIATARLEALLVSALVVVNAVGDVLDASGAVLAGARSGGGGWSADEDPLRRLRLGRPPFTDMTNTTLAVLATNARLSKVDANRLAQRGHDGMARSIKPVHTSYDGDIVFGLAAGSVDVPFDVVAELGADAVTEAIRNAVKLARSTPDVPSLRQ